MRSDEDLLESALREGWEARDPRLLELLDRRPEWRSLVEEDIDAERLERFRAQTTDDDRALVAELLAERAAAAVAAPRPPAAAAAAARRAPRVAVWAGAAALLLLVIARAFRGEPEPVSQGDPVQPLGGGVGAISCDGPSGAVVEYRELRWTAERELGPSEEYVVVVRSEDGAEVARARVRASSWAPESTAAWPDRIRWSVQRFDALGYPSGSCEGSAWRSPR